MTILVTMGMVIPQVKALFNVNNAFKPFEDPHTKDQLIMAKLVYIAIYIVILGAAIYKFSCILSKFMPKLAMGLIPVRPIDWLSLVNYIQVFFLNSHTPISLTTLRHKFNVKMKITLFLIFML